MKDNQSGSIRAMSSQYDFTPDQSSALDSLDDFLASKNPCFLLKGYAGTGKTFMTKCLVEYFKKQKWTVLLMAPTGRAARILGYRTGQKATTIHKGIYNLNEIDEVLTFKGKKEKFKFKFGLNAAFGDINTVVIVDEASMISDKEQETDFFIFGTGRLLKDLMTLTAPNNETRQVKLIFIGDNAQLPPVGDKISGALSLQYITDEFGISPQEYELTKVVRQEGDSGILTIAGYLRDLLNTRKRNCFRLPESRRDVHHTDLNDAIGKYLESWEQKGPDHAIMIHYRNRDAFDCNKEIRKVLFPGTSEVQVGDRLIITINNYNHSVELLNGTFVNVLQVFPERLVRAGIPSHKSNGEDVRITLSYRKVEIEVPGEDGPISVTCLILDSYLQNPEVELTYEEHIASYIDFKIRHPDLKPKTPAFKAAIRADLFFNAVKVKYGYAITGHKSQGGEWNTVFVNMNAPMSLYSDQYLRWSYTAVTRAASTLWLFNVPSMGVYSKLRYEPVVIGADAPVIKGGIHITLKLAAKDIAFEREYGLEKAAGHLRDHYHRLLACLQETGITIIQRTAHNNQEQYGFELGDKKVWLVYWYNGKGQFTKTMAVASKPSDKELLEKIMTRSSDPVSFTVENDDADDGMPSPANKYEAETSVPAATPEIVFPEKNLGQERMYHDLSLLVKDKGIVVSEITHHHFKERYVFQRGNESTCIDFSYDSMDNYTWVKALEKQCNSQRMLDDIASSIEELKNL